MGGLRPRVERDLCKVSQPDSLTLTEHLLCSRQLARNSDRKPIAYLLGRECQKMNMNKQIRDYQVWVNLGRR